MKKFFIFFITCLFVRFVDTFGSCSHKLSNESEDSIMHHVLSYNIAQCFVNYPHIDSIVNCNKVSDSILVIGENIPLDSSKFSNNQTLLSIHNLRSIEGISIEILLEGDVIGISNKNQINEVDQAECVWFRNEIEIARGEKFLYVGNPIEEGVYKVELYYSGKLISEIERFIQSEHSPVRAYPSMVRTSQPFTIRSGKFRTCKVYTIDGKPIDIDYIIDSDNLKIRGISNKGCYLVMVFTESGDAHKIKVWVLE